MRKHWQEQADSVIVSVIIQIFSHPPFSLKSLHIFPLNTRLNIFKLPQEGKEGAIGWERDEAHRADGRALLMENVLHCCCHRQ